MGSFRTNSRQKVNLSREKVYPPRGGQWQIKMTSKSRSLAQIFLYMAENRLKSALEVENFQNMACEANVESFENLRCGINGRTTASKNHKLDYIYDNEPLGFEKGPQETNKKMQAQDPLEEVDLGDEAVKRLAHISVKIKLGTKKEVIKLLKEFKDWVAWNYNEMPGLS